MIDRCDSDRVSRWLIPGLKWESGIGGDDILSFLLAGEDQWIG